PSLVLRYSKSEIEHITLSGSVVAEELVTAQVLKQHSGTETAQYIGCVDFVLSDIFKEGKLDVEETTKELETRLSNTVLHGGRGGSSSGGTAEQSVPESSPTAGGGVPPPRYPPNDPRFRPHPHDDGFRGLLIGPGHPMFTPGA